MSFNEGLNGFLLYLKEGIFGSKKDLRRGVLINKTLCIFPFLSYIFQTPPGSSFVYFSSRRGKLYGTIRTRQR